jgi:hypothetical protein
MKKCSGGYMKQKKQSLMTLSCLSEKRLETRQLFQAAG